MKTLLRNCRFSGILTNILVSGDMIDYLGPDLPASDNSIDLNGKLILPGMIDLHTHIRDMKQSQKEDWGSGSRAALRGGVTTIFDMPNTNPPTVDIQSLRMKRSYAINSCVNYGFHIAATPGNFTELEAVLREENPAGIKVFLSASSSNEVIEDPDTLRKLFLLAKSFNKTVLVHSESQACIEHHTAQYAAGRNVTALDHAAIRNRQCAIHATRMVLSIAKETGARVLLLHVATAEEIQMIRTYKKAGGKNVFCEVTPHHLLLGEDALMHYGNFAKVNPPIRTKSDNAALFEGILDGTVDTIGSDHAPHAAEEKQKEYMAAPSGFPGLETTLPLLFHEVFALGRLSIDTLTSLCSRNPARILNIPRRGEIAPGFAADLIAVDPDFSYTVDPVSFASKAKYSPFTGLPASGKILFTMVNGNLSNQQGKEIRYE